MADEHFNYKEMMKLDHVLYTLGSQTYLFHAMNLCQFATMDLRNQKH
jgi:hypothetical protein